MTSSYIVQVYISYALMEASKLGGDDEEEEEPVEEQDNGNPELARAVFERGYKDLKERGEKEDVSFQVIICAFWKLEN
jgi:crooked neck